MDISIVIPHYNDFNGLKRLLNTLSESTMKEKIEVNIVDDNSDFDVFQKVKHHVDSIELNINLFQNNSGVKGAGAARNIGISNSTGKWLCFADSDDIFLPTFDKQVKKYLDSDADIVYFRPTSTNSDGSEGQRHFTYTKYFDQFEETKNDKGLRYQLSVVWSRLYSRSFVRENNLKFDEVVTSDDMTFAFESGYYAKKIEVSEIPIYSWIYTEGSLTTSKSQDKYEVYLEVIIKLNSLMKKKLSKKDYKHYGFTVIKPVTMSIFRYNYGIIYSIKLAIRLLSKGFSLIHFSEIRSFSNFFINNKYYKKR